MDSFPDLSRDLPFLAARGISPEEAGRQIATLRAPPLPIRLDRPCAPGDGIRVLDSGEIEHFTEIARSAPADVRVTRFIPASGAATRMFRSILAWQEAGREFETAALERAAAEGIPAAARLLEISRRWRDLPFWPLLLKQRFVGGLDAETLVASSDHALLFRAIIDEDGLGFANQPKALIPFHIEHGRPVTPLEEHIIEAALTRAETARICSLHFTISPEHLTVVRDALEEIVRRFEPGFGIPFHVTDSIQNPATDTLALESDGAPMREPGGTLHLHPAGHGALLENLASLHADLACVRNIDNVVPSRLRSIRVKWNRVLLGIALAVRDELFAIDAAIDDRRDGAIEEAADFLKRHFGWRAPGGADRDAIVCDRLRRPFRICAVVQNTGEPGGGPFWVRDAGGSVSRQIVELTQIDSESNGQKAIVAAATHFNPVDMVCLLTDRKGFPFDVTRCIDAETCIVTRKSAGGRTIRVLERPGLWNGSMAGWNTAFVEVPLETFNPVKSINDLLRPSHQPKGPNA
jgi:hypothetical protein